MSPKRKNMANRLRNWMKGGKKGCRKLCERDDVPQDVKDYIEKWFETGQKHAEVIIDDLENDDWTD